MSVPGETQHIVQGVFLRIKAVSMTRTMHGWEFLVEVQGSVILPDGREFVVHQQVPLTQGRQRSSKREHDATP